MNDGTPQNCAVQSSSLDQQLLLIHFKNLRRGDGRGICQVQARPDSPLEGAKYEETKDLLLQVLVIAAQHVNLLVFYDKHILRLVFHINLWGAL